MCTVTYRRILISGRLIEVSPPKYNDYPTIAGISFRYIIVEFELNY